MRPPRLATRHAPDSRALAFAVPLACALGLVTGCSAPGESSAIERDAGEDRTAGSGAVWVVDFQRYGPIPLGVELEEAIAASGGAIEAPDGSEACTATTVTGGPDDVSLMVVDGRVVRVDVRNPEVRTAEGAGVGDTEDRVRGLYAGAVEVQPHKYTEGHYLVVTPPDGSGSRLIFETGDGVVRTYRAGVLPEVAWVEGCG